VIYLLEEWMDRDQVAQSGFGHSKGGTMRLGSYPCRLEKGVALGNKRLINERHRRYEFNNTYMDTLGKAGMLFSGVCPMGLVEITRTEGHPWFLGCRFHRV
jgi:CTP synthase